MITYIEMCVLNIEDDTAGEGIKLKRQKERAICYRFSRKPFVAPSYYRKRHVRHKKKEDSRVKIYVARLIPLIISIQEGRMKSGSGL